MRSIAAPDNDIQFATVTGIQEVRQRIQERLRYWRGEWFLNSAEGLPYLTDLLGSRLDEGLVHTVIREQVLDVADVTGVSNIEITESNRVFTISLDVATIFGSVNLSQTL